MMLALVKLFFMHVALLWTINEFHTYAMLSSWSTKRLIAFSYCHNEISSKPFHTYGINTGHQFFLLVNHRFICMKGFDN